MADNTSHEPSTRDWFNSLDYVTRVPSIVGVTISDESIMNGLNDGELHTLPLRSITKTRAWGAG